MTKANKRIVIDSGQMSLFEQLKQDQAERVECAPGRMCCSARLMVAVKAQIKAAPKSRETIADEMTVLSGSEVTVHMINSWTSESHPHRLPAELLPALCEATGSDAALRVLCDTRGIYTLPGADALRAEIQKIEEETRKLQKERQKRIVFLQELETEQ